MTKFAQFKSGLSIVNDSFAMLLHHPILLTYQIILLLTEGAISIIAHNTISYPAALLFSQSQEPQTQSQFFTILNSGSFIYAWLFLAFFLGGFISNYLKVGLIIHVYFLDKSEPRSVWTYLKHSKNKLYTILGWSMLQAALWWTFLVTTFLWTYHNPYTLGYPTTPSLMSEQFANHLFSFFLFIACSLLFSLMLLALLLAVLLSFFSLPIIALENKTIWQTIKTSFSLIIKAMARVCSGSLWIILFLIVARVILALIFYSNPWPLFIGTLIINTIFGTTFEIFRTKLYSLYQKPEGNHIQYNLTQL